MISGLEANPRGISGLGGSGSEDRRGNVRTFWLHEAALEGALEDSSKKRESEDALGMRLL